DSGYEWVSNDRIQVYTKITGLRPFIESAVYTVEEMIASGNQSAGTKEKSVAHMLRGLNDWNNKKVESFAKDLFTEMTGINPDGMSKRWTEQNLNHVMHSPIPFGEPKEVLTPDITIDLDYPHTLDLDWTQVQDMGGDKYRIVLVSNNKNNSHTGHMLGSFVVQMPSGTSMQEAKQIGNSMVEYKTRGDNRRDLYLDDAALAIMNRETPWLHEGASLSTASSGPSGDMTDRPNVVPQDANRQGDGYGQMSSDELSRLNFLFETAMTSSSEAELAERIYHAGYPLSEFEVAISMFNSVDSLSGVDLADAAFDTDGRGSSFSESMALRQRDQFFGNFVEDGRFEFGC
ncbi:hypothetical protein ACFL2H_13070, partial [Planctomycetota bacterium]